MLDRELGRLLFALLATGLWAAPASGQTAGSASSRPTGVLQLLSAQEPLPDPLLAEPLSPEPLAAPPIAGPPLAPVDAQSLEWINPYEMGAGGPHARTGWQSWLPLGMTPWGPRTPLSARSTGQGIPLIGTSWLNRPYSAGWFAGAIFGTPLTDGVHQKSGFYGGYRFGWDYDFFWGLEARLGAASIGLSEPGRLGNPGTNDYWNFDANLHYYFWGDSTWRPYASVGLGVAQVAFYDRRNHRYDQTMITTPFGLGLKYHWTEWFTLRGELMDNVAYGGHHIDTLNNVSLTAGVEIRFGGVRRTYWPWNPSRKIR